MPAEPLTKRQWDALAECQRYAERGQAYWWRRASMKALIEVGYVEKGWFSDRVSFDTYRPTAAGRLALQKDAAP